MLIGIFLSFTMGLFENLPFPVFILGTQTKLSFPVYVSYTIHRVHDKDDKGGLLSSVMYTKSPFVRFCFSVMFFDLVCNWDKYSVVHFRTNAATNSTSPISTTEK